MGLHRAASLGTSVGWDSHFNGVVASRVRSTEPDAGCFPRALPRCKRRQGAPSPWAKRMWRIYCTRHGNPIACFVETPPHRGERGIQSGAHTNSEESHGDHPAAYSLLEFSMAVGRAGPMRANSACPADALGLRRTPAAAEAAPRNIPSLRAANPTRFTRMSARPGSSSLCLQQCSR